METQTEAKERAGLWCDDCGRKVDYAKIIIKHKKDAMEVITRCGLCLVTKEGTREVKAADHTVSVVKVQKTGKKPTAVEIHNNPISIRSWKEGYITIVRELLKSPGAADTLRGTFKSYIGKDNSAFRIPVDLGDGIFAEVHLSSTAMQSLTSKMVSAVGQDVTAYRFVL